MDKTRPKKLQCHRWGIKRKLVVSFTAIFSAVLFLVIQVFYNTMKSDIKQQSIEYATLYLKQLNENINAYIYEFERLTAIALSDARIKSILSSHPSRLTRIEMIDNNLYVENFLFNIYTIQPDITNIVLISTNGTLFTEGVARYCLQNIEINRMQWYNETKKKQGIITLFPDYQPAPPDVVTYRSSERIFSIARQIRPIDTTNDIGAIRIDIPFTKIQKIIETVREKSSMRIFILDDKNRIIFASDPEDPQWLDDFFNQEDVKRPFRNTAGNRIYVQNTSVYTGWTIVGIISRQQLFERTLYARNLTVFLSVIGLLITITVCMNISGFITKPIMIMRTLMGKVEEGNFDVNIDIRTNDELGYLGQSFNKMVEKINLLIRTEYELRIKKREAELKALLEEIKPHFIYNTLESIRMKAVVRGEMETAKMIETLAKLLRLNIIEGSGLTTIKEEIKHVKVYLDIQNMRYPNKFHSIVDVDEELLTLAIPKLTLQPLVENAVLHGFRSSKYDCIVIIRGYKDEHDCVVIEVIDNGSGIPEEDLLKIRRSLEAGDAEQQNHLGIKNINERIKLHFGSCYGIRIDSEWHNGTKIQIILPYISEDKPENTSSGNTDTTSL